MVTGIGTDPHIELAQAAQCGDFTTLDTILSFGEVEIRRPGPNGLSLIMLIVHGSGRDLKPGQHIECAKRLIKAGAPLDEVDRTGRSALHWAVEYNKPEMLDILLKSGANKTILDEEFKEPLDIAVEMNLLKCLSSVLRSCGKEELDSPNEEGFTWMMRAAASGNTDVCQELWNCGANPNIIDPKTGRTALHFCAEFDQAEALITLLGCDGNPKVRDKDGRTVAHVAAESEAVGCLHVLIEACSLLIMEASDDTGKTPLMLACRHEHDQTVKSLISKNINPMAKDHNGQTALHWCAKNKKGKCARLLCQYKPALCKAKDNDSHTPLHLACIAGSPEVANTLLEYDSDTTTMDDEFHTPLHLATVSNNANCIVLLAQNNADVNVSDAHGSYPIHYASAMAKDPEKLPEDAPKPASSEGVKGVPDLIFIDPLLQNRPQETAQRALESLLALLENGASPCVRDSNGAQPLFNAASEGNDSACKLLLDFGAEISAKDNHGRSALHAAAQDGHDDVLGTLLEHPDIVGNIDNTDDRGRTPLMYAAVSNHTKCVEILLNAGADPNHKDDKDISVAHCLASSGDVKSLTLLKSKGGNLSISSKSGTYALHEAALAGNHEAMQYLIENGAPVNVVDDSGITPLHCAIANDKSECCGVLIGAGMPVNPLMRTKDSRFLTPLDYALLNNRPNCAEFLANNNGLPGIIYAGIMANRIRLVWRRFRRRKYGRSRPETPRKSAVTSDTEELENMEKNLYRNVDQFIGQAMEVNNDLEDFVNQESSGRSQKGRGQRISQDNFKSYRSAKMYNTSCTEASPQDRLYFKRSVDKSLRSKSQTSLDGKEYLYTANRRLQTYEEWMMLKWQEMKDKSLHTVRWTPVRVDPPKEIDLTKPPPAKDVKILYREYDSQSGRINKVVATNPDGAKIEFRADPIIESPTGKAPAKAKRPPNRNRRVVDTDTAAAYKLPQYNFGGYNGQQSGYAKKPLKFIHPSSREKKERVPAL